MIIVINFSYDLRILQENLDIINETMNNKF